MLDKAGDALCRQVQHAIQVLSREGRPFGRALHLDQATVLRHRDVEVHLGVTVLDVAQVKPHLTAATGGFSTSGGTTPFPAR